MLQYKCREYSAAYNSFNSQTVEINENQAPFLDITQKEEELLYLE